MKTRTSIPFGALSGSAGVVTARSTRFGTILSGRAHQPGKVTPQQKDMRALFARVGRSFGRLNPIQVEAWALFAEAHNFGSRMQAKSPAVNAYVTLNCNRALLGLGMMAMPPAEIPAIPAVEYSNIIVTPGLIQFSRLVNPGTGYRLAVRMSAAASAGKTYGGGLPVLVDAGFIPEQNFADVTKVYTDRLTVKPTPGLKYFVETSWMSVATGLVGTTRCDDRICQCDL
ncbi:MAG: hypothetical protein IK038_01895 [Bacteroidaceae bacterium]|nr:hypothetical protein [Bacteroidaceae bacterium]